MTRRTDPSYRILEQNADTNQRRLTRQTNPPEIWAQENERNAQAMATRRTDLSYRISEKNADTNQRSLTRQTNPPKIRAQENERNAQAMATKRTDLAYRIREQIADTNQRRLAREQPLFYEIATKFDTSSHTYLYNQPCGLWNEECRHGCGYIHLSSSTSSTKKKCCAKGALSSVSHNFDEELKMRFGLDEMPLFMRLATTRCKFCQDCTKYNNLFAMAATKVCIYCDNNAQLQQSPNLFSQRIPRELKLQRAT